MTDGDGQGNSSEITETGGEDLERRQFELGDVIFEQDTPGETAYLVTKGEIELFRGGEGREIAVATLRRGDIFGEMSLIDGKPRAATARALGDVELLVVRPDDLEFRLGRLVETDSVLRRLIDVFVRRLRGQLDRME